MRVGFKELIRQNRAFGAADQRKDHDFLHDGADDLRASLHYDSPLGNITLASAEVPLRAQVEASDDQGNPKRRLQ